MARQLKIAEIIKKSDAKNLLTIIEDDEYQILLFEGKTVYVISHEDFNSGYDTAFFNRKKITKTWKSPKELANIIEKTFPKSAQIDCNEYALEDISIWQYCQDNDMVDIHDDFCPKKGKTK